MATDYRVRLRWRKGHDVVWTIRGAASRDEAERTARAMACGEGPGIPDVCGSWEVGA